MPRVSPDPTALEREIEETRERLAGTIDQLLHRASPKTIVGREVWSIRAHYVDPATGQVRAVVTVPNASSGLVAGLFADGRIASERRTGLTAPYSAVDQRGLVPTVLRLKGGVAERIEVSLGVRDEDLERYEILTGVAAGDTLLIGAAQGITPGTNVRVSVPSDRPPAK